MRILITGGCGYIGSALTSALSKVGYDVHTVDLELRGNPLGRQNHRHDYRDLSATFFSPFQAVIHLAGHSSVHQALADPRGAIWNNLCGLLDLTDRLSGAPLLWASSGSVLSPTSGNVYDATKQAAESLVPVLYPNSYALRLGTVCGVSPNTRTDLMLNRMMIDAVQAETVFVSNGKINRPILAIADLCEAVDALLSKRNPPGAYNLCSFNAQVSAMASAVANRMNVEINIGADSPAYDFHMEPSPIHGYEPSETLRSLVESLADGFGIHRV